MNRALTVSASDQHEEQEGNILTATPMKTKITRRDFVVRGSLAGAGLGLAMGTGRSIFANPSSRVGCAEDEDQEPIIDIHQHTHYSGRTDEQLLNHQRTMGIHTTFLLPAGSAVDFGSTYYGVSNGLQAEATGNDACYQFANKYPGEFRFGANEVPDLPGATTEIEKYIKLGAPIIGEQKFGVECDSPEMQKIYELAQRSGVPVLMHWQYGMYNRGLDRFHKMLEQYPKVNFIGHAQTFWANVDKDHADQNILYPKSKVVAGGLTDQLLSAYKNMFGDLSAGSGLNSMLRDEGHARGFLERHQDQLLFGSDCSDAIGQGTECLGAQIIAAIRKLSATKNIERKILYHNAVKLFRLVG
jgi:predicted TIM-barrel fold metal-dependent hydrolase